MKNDIGFIQDLRGLAAISVVLYHASNFLGPYGEGIGGVLFGPSGAMGVALFFIISGFIMVCATSTAEASLASTMGFWVRRFARVFPLYAVVTLLFVFLSFLFSSPNIPSFQHVVSSLVFVPYGLGTPPNYGWPALNVGWTLNYEMYFYLMFGVSLFFGRMKLLFLFSWFALTVFALPYFTGRELTLMSSANYQYSRSIVNIATSPVVLMFLAGVLIGILYKSRIAFSESVSRLLILVASSVFLWQYMSPYRTGHGITEWGISLIPLVLALAISSKSLVIPSSKATTYLGSISYSLYLIHPLVLMCYGEVMQWLGLMNVAHGFAGMILIVAFSIVFAHIFNVYVEVSLSDKVRVIIVRALGLGRERKVAEPVNLGAIAK